MKPELWSHQKEAILKAKNKYALFFDPGCGKSRTALELYNKSCASKLIIFAPLNVCRNWQNEILMFSTTKKTFLVAGQSKKKKIEELTRFVETNEPCILIINLESVRSHEYLTLLKKSNAQCVIADESHNFKSPTSLQTKGFLDLLLHLNPFYVYLLTGTPAPQGEMDLYTTFFVLEKTKLPFYVWRKKYFIDLNEHRRGQQGYFPRFVVQSSSKVEFQKLLQECSVSAKKDLVLDLPPLLHENIYCELSKEQRRHYDSMYEFLFAMDENGERLNASNVLARTLRLQQIVSGFLGEKPIENTRLQALDFAVQQTNGEQFIVWTIFQKTYSQIFEHLLEKHNITSGFLTGEQSAEERHEYMTKFQAGKLRCLIANPRAGGVGVNLTAASYSIHYLKNFNLVDDLQCEARNYRGGSEIHKRITRIDIIAQDTIDERITEALRSKKSIQDFILNLKQAKEKIAA